MLAINCCPTCRTLVAQKLAPTLLQAAHANPPLEPLCPTLNAYRATGVGGKPDDTPRAHPTCALYCHRAGGKAGAHRAGGRETSRRDE
jgi:hypothetical protein